MKKLLIFFVAMFLLVPLASGAQTTPITVDLWTAFPDSQGQNGFYAYGYNTVASIYRELAQTGDHAFTTPENEYGIPLVARGTSPWVNLHPTDATRTHGPENAILAWRVPENNNYSLSGQFKLGQYAAFYIRVNNQILWSRNPAEATEVFNLPNIALKSNDLLYFEVDALGDDRDDTISLQGQIQYTPKPRTVVDLWTQFPDYQGQNSFYAYGYQAGRPTPYRALARTGDHAFTTTENEFGIPLVVRWSSPWLHLHPTIGARTYGPEHAVLAWQVPQTNTYNISGQFNLPVSSGGGDVDVYIRQNDTILWGPINILITGTQAFNFQAFLQKNDLLYFGVDARTDDGADTTELQGQVSYVPRSSAGPAADLLLLD